MFLLLPSLADWLHDLATAWPRPRQVQRGCLPAGALPLRCRRCDSRQSALDGHAAGRSSTSDVAILVGWLQWSPWCTAVEQWCLRVSCKKKTYVPYGYLVGTFEGRLFVRDPTAYETGIPTWLVSHAWTVASIRWFYARQQFFDRILTFGLNPPNVLEHISVTARACSAQWTGVLAMVLVTFFGEELIPFHLPWCTVCASPRLLLLMMYVTPKI